MDRDAHVLETILKPIQQELHAVTDRLMEQLQSPVARMAVYLITAGGKRLRPALVLLAGYRGLPHNRRALIDAATAVELVHTATLIHDDVVDRSPRRRQQPTFHERWGIERAILMGDYLYTTAFTILVRLREPFVTEVMADVARQMSQGELREVEARYNLDLTEEDYLSIVRDKTASLIAACCRIGAYLGGGRKQTVKQLTQFGWNFGMAFQIVDDCLDLIGDERRVGKTLRSDLDKGSLSLPMIYLARSLSEAQRRKLFDPLRLEGADPRVLSRIAQSAQRIGAIERAFHTARGFVTEATAALGARDGIACSAACRRLARYTIERTR